MTLDALGTNGRIATSYGGTANLTSSNGATFYPTAGSTAAETSVVFSSGVATAYVNFANAGQQTITATDNTTKSITGSAGVLVTLPDPVKQYDVILNTTVVAGSPTNVQIRAEDANGFVVRNYTTLRIPTLTLNDTAAVLPSSVTFINGIANFQVTFNTVDTVVGMTVADGGGQDRGRLRDRHDDRRGRRRCGFDLISLPYQVRAGQSVQVQIFAVDAYGRMAKGYSGTAIVAITGSATTSETVSLSGGSASFNVTFTSAAAGQQQSITDHRQGTRSLPQAVAYTAVTSSGRPVRFPFPFRWVRLRAAAVVQVAAARDGGGGSGGRRPGGGGGSGGGGSGGSGGGSTSPTTVKAELVRLCGPGRQRIGFVRLGNVDRAHRHRFRHGLLGRMGWHRRLPV